MPTRIPKALNEGEERLALQLKSKKIPFEREYPFFAARKWRFDFCFPAIRLAVEIDGGLYARDGGRHNRAGGYIKDMEKMNKAVEMGFRVLHFTPQQVKSGVALGEIENIMRMEFFRP